MSSNSKKQSIVGNMLLSLGSIALLLLMFEAIARYFIYAPIGTPWQHRVPHPTLGWALEPEVEYLYLLPEDRVLVQHNEHGFRDSPATGFPADTDNRILVLGDSFMEGYSVDLESSFHKVLEKHLKDVVADTHVVNLGTGGYGTLQEYMLFDKYAQELEPTLVLLGFYLGNDLRNNLMELEALAVDSSNSKIASRPFFVNDGSETVVTTEVDYAGAMDRYAIGRETAYAGWKSYRRWSRLIDLAALVDNRLALRRSQAKTGNSVSANRQYVKYGMHYCQPDPRFARALEVTGKLLTLLKQRVERNGARLVVFTVPALHEVETKRVEHEQLSKSVSDSLCIQEAPGYARLENLLKDASIDYVNLLPDFRNFSIKTSVVSKTDSADNKPLLFRRSDLHWSPAGHQLAARKVAAYLHNNSVVK